MVAMIVTFAAPTSASPSSAPPVATPWSPVLASGSGSAVGPDGALYVTEGATGRVLRVDPETGAVTTFASGLPTSIIGIGGAMDVAFLGGTAYVLVTLVGPDVGGTNTVGIYRVDGPTSFTVIADIGTFSIQHPPVPAFFIPSGVQYAMDTYRGGFLVTDGHHNRVLRVTLDGEISELIAFDDIVPTGLAIRGNTVYMAEAGPSPTCPRTAKSSRSRRNRRPPKRWRRAADCSSTWSSAAGHSLYALSQGFFVPGHPEGSPAEPNTGSLLRVTDDGSFTPVVDGLNQPTSLEFIGDTAYVVMLSGEVWKIDDVFGRGHSEDDSR